MRFHTGRKEAQSSQRVSFTEECRTCLWCATTDAALSRAKYIEGLENRLGRMETLLKLSGLLSEEDVGKTDLGILERRLASRSTTSESTMQRKTSATMTSAGNPSTPSLQSTPQVDVISTPRTSGTSPDSPKEPEHEVEALSDMMCSLVTNNCGETRYIGTISS